LNLGQALGGQGVAGFEAQRRFVADASHELRSPLTVMRGDLDVALRRERSVEELRAVLERLREEVDDMTVLAGNLLVLARADAGLPASALSEADLADVVDRVVAKAAAQAEASGVALSASAAASPVRGDAALLERAIGNLVENALQHAPRGSRVAVRCAVGGGGATVEVEDDGPGIGPEHAAHVFDRFYRADPARGRDAGAGLGLPIARAIAEAHGGTLTFVRERPGALFRMTLPLAPDGSPKP